MKIINQKRFSANYVKPVKPVKIKECIEYKNRIDKILEMIDIKNIDIEMFDLLMEDKTFKKEVENYLKKQFRGLFRKTDFLKSYIIHKEDYFFSREDGVLTITYIPEEDKQTANNIIKKAFQKAIIRNQYLVEDFELMFAY